MKYFHLFIAFTFFEINFVFGQTQRMVLYEGFTNASCIYCPAANQTAQSLILSNLSKVAPLKYHVNWPGTDPMNTQTQTWVGPRVTYYNITGVPASRVDGAASTNFTQTTINQRYAIPSPFSMNISHSFNTTFDSVFFSVYIKAEQNISMSSLYLLTAMVEKKIEFSTPPGTNGERIFYNVMRRMYPNATGILLPSSWTVGKDTTIHFSERIPTYIYDKNQIAFVAFIQTNSDKIVHQSTKTIYNYHVGITNDNMPKFPTCSNVLNLQLTATNFGKNTITSFDVEYGIIGQTPQIYNWSGTLHWGEQTNINLPQITITSPNSVVYAEIKNLNGSNNQDVSDLVRIEKTYPLIHNYVNIPFAENFTTAIFPPLGWFVVSDDYLTWTRSSAGGGSAKMEFFSSPNGQIDYLYLKPLNLNNPGSIIKMSFSVAHAPYNTQYGPNDKLEVQISTNCGQSWTTIYNKSGATGLSTAPATTNQFTPTSNQWRTDSIDLSTYNDKEEILIRFKATSGYGNNLYIDNVKIDVLTSLTDYENEHIIIYPNPVDNILFIELLPQINNAFIQITDLTGKIIHNTKTNGNEKVSIDFSNIEQGIYFVKVYENQHTIANKIIIKN